MTQRSSASRLATGALVLALALLAAADAMARKQPRPGPNGNYVERYLLEFRLRDVNPAADSFGPAEGDPPSMPLYRGGELVGYAYDTWDTTEAVGYSRKPFHILAGIDLEGRLTGVKLMWHLEPIASLGRTDADFRRYLAQFEGHDAGRGVRVLFDGALRAGTRSNAERRIDGLSRVTTSSMLFADAVLRGARLVARARGIDLTETAGARRLDLERFDGMTWPELEADGALAHRAIPRSALAGPDGAGGDSVAVEIWAALVDPAGIGVPLLGHRGHGRYTVGRSLDDSAIFVATRGPRPVLPRADRDPEAFPALQLVQDGATIRLTEDRFDPVMYLTGEGRPKDAAQGLFRVSAAEGFDPTRPWRIELALPGAAGGTALFALDYALPARYLVSGAEPPESAAPDAAESRPGAGGTAIERSGFRRRGADMAGFGVPPPRGEAGEPPDVGPAENAPAAKIDAAPEALAVAMFADDPGGPDWRAEWRAQRMPAMVLGVTLAALLVVLSMQEAIVRRHRLHLAVRVGFLAWTLGWVGWAAGAQLSVLHVINWIQSVEVGFDLGFFLMEPLIFLVTAFVAVSALLWGRAAFCGWLCPFGALQELLNRLAQRLRIPQIVLPEAVAERLTALKYLIFVGLAALSFLAVDLAHAASSVEPFKTAITFRFDAPWPAVVYALVLLGIGLTIERFYCRFVCPLGAGLAILGRLRMFDWLKRRVECGNPCARCEKVCPVGAIRKDGGIDMNECFYCLDCQVVYYDEHRCPPLIGRRRRREAARGGGLPDLVHAIEPAADR